MDHEPFKIAILIDDVLCDKLKLRACHHTPALIVAVTDRIHEAAVALEHLPGPIPPLDPSTCLTTEICSIRNMIFFSIYHWDDFIDKSKCFENGDFVFAQEI
jgi:hypothetical protein